MASAWIFQGLVFFFHSFRENMHFPGSKGSKVLLWVCLFFFLSFPSLYPCLLPSFQLVFSLLPTSLQLGDKDLLRVPPLWPPAPTSQTLRESSSHGSQWEATPPSLLKAMASFTGPLPKDLQLVQSLPEKLPNWGPGRFRLVTFSLRETRGTDFWQKTLCMAKISSCLLKNRYGSTSPRSPKGIRIREIAPQTSSLTLAQKGALLPSRIQSQHPFFLPP